MALAKKLLLLLSVLLLWTEAAQATTYYWVGPAGGTWSNGENWNTAQSSSALATSRAALGSDVSDVLVFSGGTNNVVVDVSETITQLLFIDNSNTTLSVGSGTADITIGGASGDDFVVEANSSLVVVGTSEDVATPSNLSFTLAGPATATIEGPVVFTTANTGAASTSIQFRGARAGSFEFNGSGSLRTSGFLTGMPFGASPAGLAAFQAGSTFEQGVGTDPYGPAAFLPGSTYRYVAGTYGPFTSNRSYGNLEFRNASATALTVTGAFSLTISNNLITSSTNASTNIGITGANGTRIGGNYVGTAGTINFTPASRTPVTFNGAGPQSIGGPVAPTFNPTAELTINNSSSDGVTLEVPINLSLMKLTAGLLNTSTTNLPTFEVAAGVNENISGASSASFINGPVARLGNKQSPPMLFPIGKVSATGTSNYRPLTLTITAQRDGATKFTAEQIEASAAAVAGVGSLNRVSTRRYFKVTPYDPLLGTPSAPSDFRGTIRLSFGSDDFVTNPSASSLVVAIKSSANTAWTSLGHGASTSTTLTSSSFMVTGPNVPATAFGANAMFTLAGTGPATENPLPAELTQFAATPKADGVWLSWTTAQEKNNHHFDVQRSATGEAFETIGKVEGQGNSSTAHSYGLLDGRPLGGTSYYRLRQVDVDGTSAYSPVVAVQSPLRADAALYPNPSAGTFIFPPALGAVRYRLCNALGQVLRSGQAAGNDRLDLTALPPGILLLELNSAAGRSTQRLLRE